ncbi:unnamed protein product, partial [Mesorhabditis belari]|uniref:Uncharacterized protein n=1 Tax=Mesorhabditis belari TaxID=2138241 RepID=A0AAF3J7Y5_9BILA
MSATPSLRSRTPIFRSPPQRLRSFSSGSSIGSNIACTTTLRNLDAAGFAACLVPLTSSSTQLPQKDLVHTTVLRNLIAAGLTQADDLMIHPSSMVQDMPSKSPVAVVTPQKRRRSGNHIKKNNDCPKCYKTMSGKACLKWWHTRCFDITLHYRADEAKARARDGKLLGAACRQNI